ncbi:MAG: tetratricopeptide repeat protein [Acidimicrobiia bacterium]|nr:tetratricopeptide repeat protein [Acidimicrobiia bacterium]
MRARVIRLSIAGLALAAVGVGVAAIAQSREAESVLQRARTDISRGRYQDALTALRPVTDAAPGGDAALELGLLQLYLGRRDEGRRTLQAVAARNAGATSPATLLRAGQAARALGAYQDANSFFRDANAHVPEDPAVNTAWGELFLEKYSKSEAAKSFQAALAAEPVRVSALVGLARTVLDDNPPRARELAEQALETDATSVPALLVLADLELGDAREAEARAWLNKALALNPASLEALSLQAALLYLDDRTAAFDEAVAGVLAINPTYGEVYRVAGAQAARRYRFPEAEVLTRRALDLDPANTAAWAQLGMTLLRTGDEPGARTALETAFERDPFDVVTYNSLTLLDTLDEQYETVTEGNLVVRLHRDEAGVMREYATSLAREALDALEAHWSFTAEGPILIEMFARHDDFAVRTLGLPGMIGALGACFGRVVTVDSPRALPPGEFNWAATLWHELAHVITLQLSSQRVPRWLSEGISEFEEKRARAEWARPMHLEFAHALNQGGAIPLAELNAAFSDPQRIGMAYFQAGQVVEHLLEAYGQDKLRALVAVFATGVDTPEAMTSTFGVSIDELQAGFDRFVEERFGALKRAMQRPDGLKEAGGAGLEKLLEQHPDSYPLLVLQGQTLREAGDYDGAIRAYERAAALAPQAAGEDSPNMHIARIASDRKDTDRAVRALDAVVAVDGTNLEAARMLASLAEPRGDRSRTARALSAVVEIDPFDLGAGARLGRLALETGDAATAIPAFKAVLGGGPVDRAAAHADLADAYLLAGRRPDARRETLAALEIAPGFERAQDLLLELLE